MNKLFLMAALLMSFTTASAAEFDWSQLAIDHQINGQTLKISRMNFQQRIFAFQFCQKIGMELADMKTIHQAGTSTENPLKQAKWRMDLGQRTVIGVWGWTSEKVVKANDAKVFIYSDIEKEGEFKIHFDQFGDLNKVLVESGLTPHKGLPAICRPISK